MSALSGRVPHVRPPPAGLRGSIKKPSEFALNSMDEAASRMALMKRNQRNLGESDFGPFLLCTKQAPTGA
jgi:hypothetical protein